MFLVTVKIIRKKYIDMKILYEEDKKCNPNWEQKENLVWQSMYEDTSKHIVSLLTDSNFQWREKNQIWFFRK